MFHWLSYPGSRPLITADTPLTLAGDFWGTPAKISEHVGCVDDKRTLDITKSVALFISLK